MDAILDAMSHQFDDDLTCRCGITHMEHQENPKRCPKERSTVGYHPIKLSYMSDIAMRRMERGLTIRQVAELVGVSPRQVSRVERGELSGHGRASVAVADRVTEFIRNGK